MSKRPRESDELLEQLRLVCNDPHHVQGILANQNVATIADIVTRVLTAANSDAPSNAKRQKTMLSVQRIVLALNELAFAIGADLASSTVENVVRFVGRYTMILFMAAVTTDIIKGAATDWPPALITSFEITAQFLAGKVIELQKKRKHRSRP
ncbi:hypothetical protein AAVH_23564 [Aphelenchoides avenae]|nr:hypothetical protein AAVH_23564 [Aphelenchus avenae]